MATGQTPPLPQTPHPRQDIKPFKHFDGDAARYDRAKPPYPGDLIRRVVAAMGGHSVLDVGCGTGIEARQFQASGCTVLGVDPDAGLAEYARGTGVPVEVSSFETWDASGRMFDAVVAGTAWHWVDPVVGVAKAAEVLRPGGLLAPMHHAMHTPPELADAVGAGLPAWTTRAAAAYRRAAPCSVFAPDGRRKSSPELYQALFDEIGGWIIRTNSFTEIEQWQFAWEKTYSRDEWLDQLPTFGSFARFSPGEQATALEEVGTTIDGMGGSFTMPYTTVAVIATRR